MNDCPDFATFSILVHAVLGIGWAVTGIALCIALARLMRRG